MVERVHYYTCVCVCPGVQLQVELVLDLHSSVMEARDNMEAIAHLTQVSFNPQPRLCHHFTCTQVCVFTGVGGASLAVALT